MRILIVDNDSRIVELVAWFLEQRGFGVARAESFERARQLLATELPDLMLSDIDLGAEDGRVELWRLAREGVLPPTLVVSGFLSPEVRAALEGLPGLVGMLSKPFDFDVLEERIRTAFQTLAGPASGLDSGSNGAADRLDLEAPAPALPTRVIPSPVPPVLSGPERVEPRPTPPEAPPGPLPGPSSRQSSGENSSDDDGWIEVTADGGGA